MTADVEVSGSQRSIINFHEYKSVRRRQPRREPASSSLLKRLDHGLVRASSLRYCDLHKHQAAHHAVEKGIGGHIELQRAIRRGLSPFRLEHRPDSPRVTRRRGTKGREIVLPDEGLRHAVKQSRVQLGTDPPGEPLTERVPRAPTEH